MWNAIVFFFCFLSLLYDKLEKFVRCSYVFLWYLISCPPSDNDHQESFCCRRPSQSYLFWTWLCKSGTLSCWVGGGIRFFCPLIPLLFYRLIQPILFIQIKTASGISFWSHLMFLSSCFLLITIFSANFFCSLSLLRKALTAWSAILTAQNLILGYCLMQWHRNVRKLIFTVKKCFFICCLRFFIN